MDYTRPGDKLPQAILAGMPVPEKVSIKTEQSVVMQRLNHWYSLGFNCIVGCWRDKGKGVMEVDYLRSLLMHKCP
jgi:hypothetical protein